MGVFEVAIADRAGATSAGVGLIGVVRAVLRWGVSSDHFFIRQLQQLRQTQKKAGS